jgi:hypothetical protein
VISRTTRTLSITMSMTSSSADRALEPRRLRLVADVSLDAYLLTKAVHFDSPAEGRHWERSASGLLVRPGLSRRQGAGLLTLFGARAASGTGHELDAAADGGADQIIVEAKATGSGVGKADVTLFHAKSFDFFCANPQRASKQRWWRLLIAGTSVKESARRMCAHLGILLCDPARLPLPVLLWAASRPSADLYLPDPLIREAVRLMEPAVLGLQEIWRYTPATQEIRFRPSRKASRWIDDLLYVQDALSAEVLDLYDRQAPNLLPRRSAKLIGLHARAA